MESRERGGGGGERWRCRQRSGFGRHGGSPALPRRVMSP
ncbi:unnamed protein product [Spirodela intermedia]|uniref:Uncharacterized protein n=1 Tax=Spirodela intermedia TaxID=51605 RepID=A0A7I8KNV7_SPIIN|nr:unnamed protein product [Spirodela intermedia]